MGMGVLAQKMKYIYIFNNFFCQKTSLEHPFLDKQVIGRFPAAHQQAGNLNSNPGLPLIYGLTCVNIASANSHH